MPIDYAASGPVRLAGAVEDPGSWRHTAQARHAVATAPLHGFSDSNSMAFDCVSLSDRFFVCGNRGERHQFPARSARQPETAPRPPAMTRLPA